MIHSNESQWPMRAQLDSIEQTESSMDWIASFFVWIEKKANGTYGDLIV